MPTELSRESNEALKKKKMMSKFKKKEICRYL